MGLANRVVPTGCAIQEAQLLAKSLTQFPQQCMRNDRLSTYQQWEYSVQDAMDNEFQLGMQTILSNETFIGAKRFAEGKGRHGDFGDI